MYNVGDKVITDYYLTIDPEDRGDYLGQYEAEIRRIGPENQYGQIYVVRILQELVPGEKEDFVTTVGDMIRVNEAYIKGPALPKYEAPKRKFKISQRNKYEPGDLVLIHLFVRETGLLHFEGVEVVGRVLGRSYLSGERYDVEILHAFYREDEVLYPEVKDHYGRVEVIQGAKLVPYKGMPEVPKKKFKIGQAPGMYKPGEIVVADMYDTIAPKDKGKYRGTYKIEIIEEEEPGEPPYYGIIYKTKILEVLRPSPDGHSFRSYSGNPIRVNEEYIHKVLPQIPKMKFKIGQRDFKYKVGDVLQSKRFSDRTLKIVEVPDDGSKFYRVEVQESDVLPYQGYLDEGKVDEFYDLLTLPYQAPKTKFKVSTREDRTEELLDSIESELQTREAIWNGSLELVS